MYSELSVTPNSEQKSSDEARLADARFARDEHDLPFATPGFVQPTVQLYKFGFTTD